MHYHEQPFSARLGTLGDEAEGVFEAVNLFGTFDRTGWNRPRSAMSKMSAFTRHKPDYWSGGYYIEVMGLGRDDILKLKTSKYEALKEWNQKDPVMLFVWSSHYQHWLILNWEGIKKAWRRSKHHGTKRFENDGNEYVEIPWSTLESIAEWGAPYAVQ